VAFVGTFVMPMVSSQHRGLDDDAACGQPSFLIGHPVTQIESVIEGSPPEHCPFCHFQRAMGGASPSAATALAHPVIVAPAACSAARHVRSVAHDERPSRAPPSLVLS
jgi:hypothetical protein